MAADRFNFNKSWEYIQSKYVGTGHSDMTKFEWASNQHRDTYASYLGHYDMQSYFAVAQNDSIGRVRYQMLEVCRTDHHLPEENVLINFFQKLLRCLHTNRKCSNRADLLLLERKT